MIIQNAFKKNIYYSNTPIISTILPLNTLTNISIFYCNNIISSVIFIVKINSRKCSTNLKMPSKHHKML